MHGRLSKFTRVSFAVTLTTYLRIHVGHFSKFVGRGAHRIYRAGIFDCYGSALICMYISVCCRLLLIKTSYLETLEITKKFKDFIEKIRQIESYVLKLEN